MDPSTRAEAYLHACFLALNSDLAAGEALAERAEQLAEQTADQQAAAIAAVATGMAALYRGDAQTLRAACTDRSMSSTASHASSPTTTSGGSTHSREHTSPPTNT